MKREKPGPGQESVWDYPRPPLLEASTKLVRVMLAGELIALSSKCYRVLETSHPPSWYIPASDVKMQFLTATKKQSFCEWKGSASYWSARIGETVEQDAAWSYEAPTDRFALIKSHFAFYPDRFECFVDEQRVKPQPGGFYGGWITPDVVGPFKGGPESWGW